jgi:GAF domain-containing protein
VIQCTIRDVTERKQTEEFILQAKKLSEALNRINESLHSTLNPDEVAQSLVNEGAAALGCDTAAISLREGNGWRVSFVHGMAANVVGARMTDDQEGHALLAFETCQPVAVPDALNDDRFNRQHLRDHNIRAVLVAPLIVKGKPQGVIFFNYHDGPHAFTEPELQFVRHLASSASIALENSRQFGDIKQAGEVLKLQAQLLRESNRELESFITLVSHDLRAPLQAIDGYSKMLLEQQGDKFDAETRRQVEAIRDNVKSMARLIEDLLASSRSERPR